MAPIYTVIVPALSRLQTEPDRYRSAFLQVFEGLAITAFVLTGLVFSLSDVVVKVILGDQWDAAAPIFAALTFAFVYLPLATATSWLYTSQGRGRDLLVAAGLGAAIMVGAYLAGLPFGATGVAVAYSASGLLAILPVTFYMGGRTGPVSSRDLWGAAVSHVPNFAAVLSATWVSREWIAHSLPPLPQLVVCSGIGCVAGMATLLTFARSRRAVTSLVARIKELRNHRIEEPLVEGAM
jgi:PST family polysaccharide transporter